MNSSSPCSSSRTSSDEVVSCETIWQKKAAVSKRDLIIKKIAVGTIALLNLAGLGTALYFICLYTPIPTQSLLVSPFFVGVLAALAYLKFPTCGLKSSNYRTILNPAYLIGRVSAYIFFGPLMYAVDKVDWIPYHDPIRANKISSQLEKADFKTIAENYGPHFDNLIKYGFIPQEFREEFLQLYKTYEHQKRALLFWKQEDDDSEEYAEAKKHIEELNSAWQELKKKFPENFFPHPVKPRYDFSKKTTPFALQMRSYCCLRPPLEILP